MWSQKATKFSLKDKTLSEIALPILPVRLFGPSVRATSKSVIVAGVDQDDPVHTHILTLEVND